MDAGEVVDVVLLNDRGREVVNGAFKDVLDQVGSGDGLWRADGSESAAAVAAEAEVNADSRLPFLEDGEALWLTRLREPIGVRTMRSSSLNVVVFGADRERTGFQPDHQEGWLIQCPCEFAVAEVQRKVWRAAASNGGAIFGIALPAAFGAELEEALAWLDQGGDFGFFQRTAVEADRTDFAIERSRYLEVGSFIVELCAANVCLRCEGTIDVEKRFVMASADNGGHVAPLIRTDNAGSGGNGGSSAFGFSGGLEPQRCPVVRDFQEPAAGSVSSTQR